MEYNKNKIMESKRKVSMQSQSIKVFFRETIKETSPTSNVLCCLMALCTCIIIAICYCQIGYDKNWWHAGELHQLFHGVTTSLLEITEIKI